MAYKQVVEMLGDNLASLLELAKKWLIDWKIEPKKLFHLFQQIRKDDINGLIAGTHEIKAKEKQAVASPADDEYFEQIFESDYITIPDMTTVVAYAKDKWSKEMGSVTPSTLLVAGEKKKVKVFRFKKGPSSQHCVDFIKAQGATLSNVFGLAVAEMIVGSQLPRDKWILGFDNRDNLSADALGRRGVPRLCLDSDSSVGRGWSRWGGDWGADNCLVLLCD